MPRQGFVSVRIRERAPRAKVRAEARVVWSAKASAGVSAIRGEGETESGDREGRGQRARTWAGMGAWWV